MPSMEEISGQKVRASEARRQKSSEGFRFMTETYIRRPDPNIRVGIHNVRPIFHISEGLFEPLDGQSYDFCRI